jgi:hypothetical protein
VHLIHVRNQNDTVLVRRRTAVELLLHYRAQTTLKKSSELLWRIEPVLHLVLDHLL